MQQNKHEGHQVFLYFVLLLCLLKSIESRTYARARGAERRCVLISEMWTAIAGNNEAETKLESRPDGGEMVWCRGQTHSLVDRSELT